MRADELNIARYSVPGGIDPRLALLVEVSHPRRHRRAASVSSPVRCFADPAFWVPSACVLPSNDMHHRLTLAHRRHYPCILANFALVCAHMIQRNPLTPYKKRFFVASLMPYIFFLIILGMTAKVLFD